MGVEVLKQRHSINYGIVRLVNIDVWYSAVNEAAVWLSMLRV